MPEVLRALGVILMLATMVFFWGRPVFSAGLIHNDSFVRRRNLWLAIVIVTFLAHSFWIYILVVAFLLNRVRPAEANPVALYFFILFAVPDFSERVPGLGIANFLIDISYVRMLAIVLFLPAFFDILRDPTVPRFGKLSADRWIGAYLVLEFVLMLLASTFTNAIRVGVVYAFLDVVLPYFVISRSLVRVDRMRDAIVSFCIAALLLSAIAVFESVRHWLLYASLEHSLGVESSWLVYLERGEGGLLRAQASAGHSIPLGFVIALSIALFFGLRPLFAGGRNWVVGILLLLVGLVAPVSRGPWVGAVFMLLVLLATGPSALVRIGKLAIVGAVAGSAVLASPAGESVLRFLPFVGEADHTITYRQRLLQVSLELMLDHPFFGAFDYIYSPAMQELRQGQGIVDVVNTYVAIGLGKGLIGLGLFVGFFGTVAIGILRGMRQQVKVKEQKEIHLIGRSLLAVILGILLMIGTVSSVTIIPNVYWAMAGVGVAYMALASQLSSSGVEETVERHTRSHSREGDSPNVGSPR